MLRQMGMAKLTGAFLQLFVVNVPKLSMHHKVQISPKPVTFI
jgi:hypothetical protein